MIMRTAKALWARWKIIARRIGDFQARVLLSLYYFAILGPFALGVKTFSDPLRLRPRASRGWLTRRSGNGEPLTSARRQF